jgi:hypothetical protein
MQDHNYRAWRMMFQNYTRAELIFGLAVLLLLLLWMLFESNMAHAQWHPRCYDYFSCRGLQWSDGWMPPVYRRRPQVNPGGFIGRGAMWGYPGWYGIRQRWWGW